MCCFSLLAENFGLETPASYGIPDFINVFQSPRGEFWFRNEPSHKSLSLIVPFQSPRGEFWFRNTLSNDYAVASDEAFQSPRGEFWFRNYTLGNH